MVVVVYDWMTEIELHKYEKITVLDVGQNLQQKRFFEVPESCVFTYVFLWFEWKIDVEIILVGDNAEADVRALLVGEANSSADLNMYVHIESSHANANMYTLSLLQSGANLSVDGGVILWKSVIKSQGELLEENILLGEDVRIKTLPLLDVHANDILASHAARIHRLSGEKLFYLQSKWISEKAAKEIFVESYVRKVFEKITAIDEKLAAEYISNCMQRLVF